MKKTSFVLALVFGFLFVPALGEAAIDGHLRITSPNGGETYTEGETTTITWDASSNIDKVSIGWSTGPGSLNWIAFTAPNTGSYTWKVDVGNTTRTQFLIDITGYETGKGSLNDKSDGYFTVHQKNEYPATPPSNPSPAPTPTPAAAPTLTFSADQTSVAFGGATTLRWSSSNTNSCQAGEAWSGAKSPNGSQTTGSLTAARSFTLTCTGPGGSVSRSVYVSVAAEATTPSPSTGKGPTTGAVPPQVAASTPLVLSRVTMGSVFYWEGSRTTVLSDIEDPTHVENFTLDVFGAGFIIWEEVIDISSQEALAALDKADSYVTITSWYFYMAYEFWAIWETPVEVTLRNPEVVAEPVIYKDGRPADVGEVKVTKNEEGGSDITFTATEGGKYEVKHAIVLDEKEPKITARAETYTIAGYISDPTAVVTVTVNGEAMSEKITPDPKTGRFERAVSLILGNNQIALAAESEKSTIDPVSLSINRVEGGNWWVYALGAFILLAGILYGLLRNRKGATV